jgi:serpin B
MKTTIFGFIAVVLLFISCEKQDSANSDSKPINLTTEESQLVTSSNSFGLNIFKTIASNTEEDENVFISPLSISLALSMLYNGSSSTTKEELQKGLGFMGLTTEQVNTANRDLIKALINVDSRIKIQIANSIWYKNDFEVEQSFLTVNKDYYNAEVNSAKFNSETKDLINNWVSNATNKKIPTILDEIPSDVIMYLINAIYFKGIWQYKFDTKQTQKMEFTLINKNKIQTDFMHQKGTFEIVENDLLTAVNLPYGKGNYSMMILVPAENRTYKDILNALNEENWNEWNSKLSKSEDLDVYMPKFKFKYKRTLNDDLQALGMKTMFSDYADLTGIRKAGGIAVSRVLHNTFVDVNEEGTEAAAATAIEIKYTAARISNLFIADKPFVFIIKEKDSNAMLFMGVLNKPVIED